jgi:hypothetical protein
VQVVEVHVRDQHGVDCGPSVEGNLVMPPQVPDAVGQDGIGDEARAGQIEDDGRVAHPRELTLRIRRHGQRA